MFKIVPAIALTLLMWLGAGEPATAQDGRWLRAETANFIVYSDRDERSLRQAAQRLEDLDATLRVITGATAPPAETKLEVYLVHELTTVWPDVPSGYRGFYTSTPEAMAAISIFDNENGMSRTQVLFHEYAHHFMLHYFPDAYPKWYVEGWADYVSTIVFHARQAVVGERSTRAYDAMSLGLMPMATLLTPERFEQTEVFQRSFYATSWLAAFYVVSNAERQAKLHRLVAALARGEEAAPAFTAAFGVTPEQFDRELLTFGRTERTGRLGVTLNPEPAAVTIERMPAAEDNLLLPVLRARLHQYTPETQTALAADLDRYASAYPNDPYAQRAMARAALLRDDSAGARARLEPLLAADNSDVEAHYLMGRSYVHDAEQADTGQSESDALHNARRQLAAAIRARPDHYPSLYLYARTAERVGAAMTQNQLDVLSRAFTLAPQVSTIRIALARELMMVEHYDDAVIVLQPLVYSPHDAGMSAFARAMSDAARRHEPPPEYREPEPSQEAGEPGG